MYTLEIGKEIKTFDGRTIITDSSMQPMTIKDIVLHYLGVYNSQDGKRLIEAYRLGIRVADCREPTINIENQDFLLIKEAIQKPSHGALIAGQLQEAIEQAETTKK